MLGTMTTQSQTSHTPPDEPRLTVIIPCFNEELRLGSHLREVKSYLDAHLPGSEILVIDDGSKDKTRQVAEEILGPGSVISHPINRGKGAAVCTGVAAARGRFVLFTDADGSTPIQEVEKLLPHVESNCDVAIGSRATRKTGLFTFSSAGKSCEKKWLDAAQFHWNTHPMRVGMGRVYAYSVQLILGLPFQDTQCGFKLFRRAEAQAIFPQVTMKGYSFDVEVLALARSRNLTVAEVPVSWHHIPGSRVSIFRDAPKMFADLLTLRSAKST
ncbi:MAG: dolichyl-phosphate beta-glucosyltransferase [Planctomycetota bacterium]